MKHKTSVFFKFDSRNKKYSSDHRTSVHRHYLSKDHILNINRLIKGITFHRIIITKISIFKSSI